MTVPAPAGTEEGLGVRDEPVRARDGTPPTADRTGFRDKRRRGSGNGRSWLVGLVGALALLGWLFVLTVHANSGNVTSDGATVVLQGKAVASGNVLLHGWSLSLDSWWTLDVAFYALATAVFGVRSGMLLAIPALIATLVILAGVVLAGRGRRDRAALAGAAVVVAVLALPAHQFVTQFICGPMHVSTVLYALIAFIGLRRNRFGWGWVVAVVFLAAGLLGDLQIAAYGVIPALFAGLVAMGRRRSVRAGVVPVTAAAASVVGAVAVRALVDILGGFAIQPTNALASLSQLQANIRLLPSYLAQMVGVIRGASGDGGVPLALQAVHVVAAALLLVCSAVAISRLVAGVLRGAVKPEPLGTTASSVEPEPWRLDDLLVIAVMSSVVDFVVLARASSVAYERYLTATLVFAAVLGGRLVTRWVASDPRLEFRRLAAATAATAAVCFAVAAGVQVSRPPPPEPAAGLVALLEAHHLTLGIGDYWAASLTTVESNGSVVVRPIVASNRGTIEGYAKGAIQTWFAGEFQFFVYTNRSVLAGESAASASATWGRPAHYLAVGQYHVLVWSHPVEITALQPPV